MGTRSPDIIIEAVPHLIQLLFHTTFLIPVFLSNFQFTFTVSIMVILLSFLCVCEQTVKTQFLNDH